MACVNLSLFKRFQLTASRRGWPYVLNVNRWRYKFQLTASRRGWPGFSIKALLSFKYFNSQPHEEADGILFVLHYQVLLFQLTASRRGWRRKFTKAALLWYFNSQPHEEADAMAFTLHPCDLYFNSQPHEEADVSHTRTQDHNVLFQLTASRRGWRNLWVLWNWHCNFNSQPHEEADRLTTPCPC